MLSLLGQISHWSRLAHFATTSRPTRSPRCRPSSTSTSDWPGIPIQASRPATSADRRGCGQARRLHRHGWRQRYGKGSSREHSPAAEEAAGIRLVVAESFERIYRQNADNVGLFTSTTSASSSGSDGAKRSISRNWSETRRSCGHDPAQWRLASLRPGAPDR